MSSYFVVLATIVNFNVQLCSGKNAFSFNNSEDIHDVDNLVFMMQRQPRFFKLKNDNDFTNVDLQFNINTLQIPVGIMKTSATKVARSIINNGELISYALAGITALGSLSTKSGLSHLPWQKVKRRQLRISNGIHPFIEGNSTTGIAEPMEAPFQKYSKILQNCVQKSICLLVRRSEKKITADSPSMDKLINGVTSLSWFMKKLSGTVIKEAIDNGRKKKDCGSIYKSCIFKDEKILEYFEGF